MWVFTNRGLLSVVQDRENNGRLLVRARQEGLLEQLVPRPGDVFVDKLADYPFRVFLTRAEFQEVLQDEVSRIDYDNFKNSIKDREYHDVCLKVWSAGTRLGH